MRLEAEIRQLLGRLQGERSASDGARKHAIESLRLLAVVLQSPESPTKISPREQAVFELVAQGMSNKEIGRRLAISAHTAKFHVSSLLAKYGVRGRAELVTAFLKAIE
jgi:DNA-binding NarL/FixJ family response regulator